MNGRVDLRRVTRQRFIDGVVNYFVNEVVETSRGRRTDIHAGTFSNCLETLQYLNLTSVVLRRADFCCCFCHYTREKFLVRSYAVIQSSLQTKTPPQFRVLS